MNRLFVLVAGLFALGLTPIVSGAENLGPPIKVVNPGAPEKAPSDAVVLFDGADLSHWAHADGSPARWTVANGELVSKAGTGDVISKETFNDAQIHIEFATPDMPRVHGQERGNSGVYLQRHYEIQILDSYNNPTYKAGSAGSVYEQYDPLVNASRPPGQWQSYDIIFHTAKCAPDGRISQPPRVTILQNGVLIQDDAIISGPTGGGRKEGICDAGPLELQDHGTPVRFRNIWFRPL